MGVMFDVMRVKVILLELDVELEFVGGSVIYSVLVISK